jgi:hypothetical protein
MGERMTEIKADYITSLPTEAEVQRQVIEYLLKRNFLVLRINSGRSGNVRFCYWQAGDKPACSDGISDLLVLSPGGQFWAIECKKRGGKASRAQLDFIRSVIARDGGSIIAYSLACVEEMIK